MSAGTFDVADLRAAAIAIAAGVKSAKDELNSQDGKLGDGDLGITVASGWQAVADVSESFPTDVGRSFLASAKAFQQASSSSFGTMVATAFMAAAKQTMGRTEIAWSEIPDLITGARDAMMARGKGGVGDKTVLDSLDAVRAALAGLHEPSAMRAASIGAAQSSLAAFRDRPSRLGRARMFADRSVGMDDPGMLAFRRIVENLPGL
jgi:dihydroxyacetone kinase-like protein